MRKKVLSIFITVIIIMSVSASIGHNVSQSIPSSTSGESGGLADSPWPMFRQNLNHTGVSPYDTSSNPGKLKWSFKAGHLIQSSPSIGSDGTIYLGSYDDKLYAINPDGNEKWSFSTDYDVTSSPTIGSDGTIYVSSEDGKLYAINPDGTEKWSFATGFYNMGRSSPAIGSDGTIYIGSRDHKLYAIYPDGTQKWNFLTEDWIDSSPAIGIDGTIYVGSHDSKLYAINPEGTEKWSFITGGQVQSSPTIGSDGTIYVGSYDHKLYAINQDGSEKWNFMTGHSVVSSPAIGSDGAIYVGSQDGKLYTLYPDGTEKWSFTTGADVTTSPAIGIDGMIYFGSWDKKLYAINSDGTEKWSFITNGYIESSPAIGSDGTIYVGSWDNRLYAIGNSDLDVEITSHFATLNSAAQSKITVKVSEDASPIQGAIVTLSSDNGGLFSPQSGVTNSNGIFTCIFNAPTVTTETICRITADVSEGVNNDGSDDVDITLIPIPWPLYGQNSKRTGQSPYYTSSNPGKLKWSFNTGGRVISSPAIGSDGTIYVGSYDHKLYAINPDGTEKWNFITGSEVFSSPSIDSDGTIYVGSFDNNLYAINQDGTEKWHFTTYSPIRSSPIIGSDGTIYFGSDDNNVYAVNPDGTEKWSFTTGFWVRSSPTVGSDGTIYAASCDHKLYAINPDGTEEWNFMTYGSIYSSPTIGSDGIIYVGSSDNRLYAINQDGTENWSFTTGGDVYSSPAIGSNGIIYIGSFDNNLYAINEDGYEHWSFTIDDDFHSSPAIGSDGTVYVGSDNHILYAINPDGTEKWNFVTGNDVFSSPAIDMDGTIYIGSYDNNLYAIGEDDTPPIANAGPDQTGNEGDLVQFDASASHDPDGAIESYEWDFDANDGLWWETGAVPDATGPNPTHIHGDDGVYTITLRVTNYARETDTDECIVFVNNVAPTITLMMTYPDDEGSRVTFEAEATDPGSDDVTYSWELEHGPTIENTFYNDWVGPEPLYDPAINAIKTPLGNFPFRTSDVETHVYGDNYDYTITLTVTDDDGGVSTATTTVTVDNLAPSILEMNIPSQVDEGSSALFEILTSDQGSDDLTFTWNFELSSTLTNVHNNDGVGPDPYPSPWGDYPFEVWDTVNHAYGDDGIYMLFLSIEDDDGGTTTYSTDINVQNIAPTIDLVTAPGGDEGAAITFSSTSTDSGSDDLIFTWNWGDGTLDTMNIYYNDGTAPDPLRSPLGAYPFTTTDTVSHIYGDDGDYTITLTVEDDDGGLATYITTVIINNVAPSVEPFGPFSIDESLSLELTTTSTDPSSDDLTFTWEFELGPTTTNVYYNDGIAPDPYPSPWGTYPFQASDSVEHIYGDNGVYPVTLTVSDDDGGMTSFTTNITVNNVAPTITTVEAYIYVNFSLRVAGEKYHSVGIHMYEDEIEIWNAQVTRVPGSPDAQAATFSGYSINLGSSYRAVVDYLPNDPRVNGNVWGGNPVWIILEFQDGTTERLHHTFNVRQSYWDTDHWNHIDPWEVDLTGIIYRHNITFEASASDPGSDDLIFIWDFGDGGTAGPNTYFNNGVNPDPYPSPEINPMNASDTVMHAYAASGIYTITLTVMDDDGGTITTILMIVLPG